MLQICNEIDQQILTFASNDSEAPKVTASSSDETMDVRIPTEVKIAIAATSPIWVPLGIAAVVLVLPFAIGIGVWKSVKAGQFAQNPGQYLDPWAEDVLKHFTVDVLDGLIHKMLPIEKHRKIVERVFGDVLPEKITNEKKRIDMLTKESAETESIQILYHPIETEAKHALGKLYLAYSEISGLQIRLQGLETLKQECLGERNFRSGLQRVDAFASISI